MRERPARVSVSFARTLQRWCAASNADSIIFIRGSSRARCRKPIVKHLITKVARAATRTRATLPRNPRCEQRSNAFCTILPDSGLTGGDLLEIGCGYGYLLDEARAFFERRVGTEFSPQGAEIARATGAEVFVGGIEQSSD